MWLPLLIDFNLQKPSRLDRLNKKKKKKECCTRFSIGQTKKGVRNNYQYYFKRYCLYKNLNLGSENCLKRLGMLFLILAPTYLINR